MRLNQESVTGFLCAERISYSQVPGSEAVFRTQGSITATVVGSENIWTICLEAWSSNSDEH